MTNSMDVLIIRFGGIRRTEDEIKELEFAKKCLKEVAENPLLKAIYGSKKIQKYKKLVAKKDVAKELPLREFLHLDEKRLSAEEKKLQTVLNFLYHENKKNPPIYKKFPERDMPLIIDCLVATEGVRAGTFYPEKNKILFQTEKRKEENLVEILAHELKHAEQWFNQSEMSLNNYQKHQLFFLDEALATACGQFIKDRYLKICPQQKQEKIGAEKLLHSLFGELSVDKFEGDMSSAYMTDHLVNFMFSNRATHYKNKYDRWHPILYEDKALTFLPPSFGVEKKDVVSVLKTLDKLVLKKAIEPESILLQAYVNKDYKKIERICRAKKQGEYVVPDNELKNFIDFNCLDDFKFFQAATNNKRLEKEDYRMIMETLLHVEDDTVLTDDMVKNRFKIFNSLLARKDTKNKVMFMDKEIKEVLSLAESVCFNDATKTLIENVKKMMPQGKKPQISQKDPRD